MLFATFESVGVIHRLNPNQLATSSEISLSMMASVFERELQKELDVVQGPSETSQGVSADDNQPNVGEVARFLDDLDITASLDEDRLSLVVSGNHEVFHSAPIPATQRFCLG
jgi:hypothetical protein